MLTGIKKSIRDVVRLIGVDLHPYSKTEWKWGYDVHEYYPINPNPRWGYGKPPHAKLMEILQRRKDEYLMLIQEFEKYRKLYASIPQSADPEAKTPYWQNRWFYSFDAVALMGILASRRPKRYFEIGSGNSTKFARFTIDSEKLQTRITSIDPNPRAAIDAICENVVRKPLEDCDLSLFDELESGDVLFFDGSHRVFTNSDVTVFFLELLPRLRPGVIVQIHDIFLPWDYWSVWQKRLYSEQYMLAAMLLCPEPPFKVTMPNWFVCNDDGLSKLIDKTMRPLLCKTEGFSFWLETT